jgi:hypothetical protein
MRDTAVLPPQREKTMHDPRPDKAAEYRAKAGTIRTIARQISLNEPRNKLLDAARDLEVMAKEEEGKARTELPNAEAARRSL